MPLRSPKFWCSTRLLTVTLATAIELSKLASAGITVAMLNAVPGYEGVPSGIDIGSNRPMASRLPWSFWLSGVAVKIGMKSYSDPM